MAKRKITEKPKPLQPGTKPRGSTSGNAPRRTSGAETGRKEQGAQAFHKGQGAQSFRRGQATASRKDVRRQEMRHREIPWFTIAIFGMVAVGLGLIVLYRVLNWGGSPASTTADSQMPAEVTVAQAYEMYQDEDVFFLDVREQSEWDEYHIPDTTLIPLGQLGDRTSELPRDKNIVVVCRSGNRSQEGRDILLRAGFENVTSMDGGVAEWRQSGYPIE